MRCVLCFCSCWCLCPVKTSLDGIKSIPTLARYIKKCPISTACRKGNWDNRLKIELRFQRRRLPSWLLTTGLSIFHGYGKKKNYCCFFFFFNSPNPQQFSVQDRFLCSVCIICFICSLTITINCKECCTLSFPKNKILDLLFYFLTVSLFTRLCRAWLQNLQDMRRVHRRRPRM